MHMPSLARSLLAICLALSLVFAIGCNSGNDNPPPSTAPSNLSYPSNPATYTVGIAIASNRPTVTGTATMWSINPALPAGLSFHDKSGTIAGTPTAAAAQADYTVVAANSLGSTNAVVTITVEATLAAPSNLSYAINPGIYTRDVSITPNQPTVTGTVTGWSVTPALPAGLGLNVSSGVISGTPNMAVGQATYTVEASNASGSTTVDLSIRVNPPVQVTSPDAVFLADAETDGVYELYGVDKNGSGLAKLSGTVPAGARNGEVEVSPDGTMVAYLSEAVTAGTMELYVAPVDGSGPVRVSGTLAAGREVTAFDWAPDSSRLLYIADLDPIGDIDLWSVEPDGTGHSQVNGAGVTFARVDSAAWSADSSHIAFVAELGSDNTNHAYVAEPNGANQVQVSGALAVGYDAMEVRWSPDGAWVAVKVRNAAWDEVELYAAKADGSEFNMLHTALPAGHAIGSFAWAPDSSRCAFIAGQTTLEHEYELFTSAPSGSASIFRVSHGVGISQEIRLFVWAPDSSSIALMADRNGDRDHELYATDPDSAAGPIQIGGVLVSGGSVQGNFKWTPDSSRVLYIADQRAAGQFELFSSARDSMASTVLLSIDPPGAGGDVEAFKIAPDGTRVAFVADQNTQTQYEVWTQSLSAVATPIVVGPAATHQSDVEDFDWSADSSRLYYVGDTVIYNQDHLYSVDPAAANSGTAISGTSITDGDVREVWPTH